MPRFKGYSVWVEVEGKKLPEFDPEFFCDDVPLIVCYVPCEAGKKFRIGCTFPMAEIKKENHVSSVAVDGRDLSLECSVLHKNPYAKRDATQYHELDRRGDMKARGLIFSSLKPSDDETLLGKENPELGTIHMKIETYAESTAVKRKKLPKPNTAPPSDGRIHETKTNVTHFVKYGEEQSYQEPKGTFRYELFDTETLCEFKFLYRGLDMLIAKDLAPRPDPPAVHPPPPLGSGPNLQAARADLVVQSPGVSVSAALGEGNPTIPASSTSVQTKPLGSGRKRKHSAVKHEDEESAIAGVNGSEEVRVAAPNRKAPDEASAAQQDRTMPQNVSEPHEPAGTPHPGKARRPAESTSEGTKEKDSGSEILSVCRGALADLREMEGRLVQWEQRLNNAGASEPKPKRARREGGSALVHGEIIDLT